MNPSGTRPRSPAQERFPVGVRVRLSKHGIAVMGPRLARVSGVVRGYTRDGIGLLILWDGYRSLRPCECTYVERADA